jgi:small-conductance mechanosensitive channel
VDDLLLDLVGRTRGLFILLVALWAGTRALALSPPVQELLRAALVLGFLFQVGFWATALIRHALERYRIKQLEIDPGNATALGALNVLAQALLWTVILLTALANVGVDITAFVASLGLGGIAIALALQNVLGDLFASLSIVLDKPFVIGDFVVVGEFQGSIEHVGLKTTRLRSLEGEQLVFSNSDLLGSRLRNSGRMEQRRATFRRGVTYGTPTDTLRRIPTMVRQAVESRDNTRFDRCHFAEMGPYSLDFVTVYTMLVPDYASYMDTQQEINLTLYQAFAEEGIDLAFPTQTVLMGQAASDRS